MEILAPTKRFSSVDLPTLVAPIRATKPQRVGSATALGPEKREEQFSRGDFRGAARATASRGGRLSGQADLGVKQRIMGRALASGQAIGGKRQTARLGPFLQSGLR